MSTTTNLEDQDATDGKPPEEMSNDELLEYIAETDTPLGERASRALAAEREETAEDQEDSS